MTRIQSDSGQVIQVEKVDNRLQLVAWGAIDRTTSIEANLSREQAILLLDAIIGVINGIKPEPKVIELDIDPHEMLQELGQEPIRIDPFDLAILEYAVKKNRGIVKVSTVKNHVIPAYGMKPLDAAAIRNHLNFMVPEWLEKPVMVGQVYEWKVSAKGRSVVE